MSQPDLQLGGGYTYQWCCAILLALNYLHEPVAYNQALHERVNGFLGAVDAIHLEGEKIGSGIDLEDINLLGRGPDGEGECQILIQVKLKQTGYWTPRDPDLRKALFRFCRNEALDRGDSWFVFLTNQSFNPNLERIRKQIGTGAITSSPEIEALIKGVRDYAKDKHQPQPEPDRILEVLGRTIVINFLPLDAMMANVQAKLQGYGLRDWKQASDTLFARFAELSVQQGGGRVTRETLTRMLGEPLGSQGRDASLPRIPPISRPVPDFSGRTADIDELVASLHRRRRHRRDRRPTRHGRHRQDPARARRRPATPRHLSGPTHVRVAARRRAPHARGAPRPGDPRLPARAEAARRPRGTPGDSIAASSPAAEACSCSTTRRTEPRSGHCCRRPPAGRSSLPRVTSFGWKAANCTR